MMSVVVACGDDDDDDRPSKTTTTSTTTRTTSTSTSTSGSTGSGGSSTTNGTTNGTTTRGTATGTATGSGGTAGDSGMGGEGGMAGAAFLMDGEILHAVRTANMGEVEQSEIAVTRGDDDDVREFAQMMVDDHSAAVAAADDLADAQGITPQPNSVSQDLQSESERIITMLEAAQGDAFDLVYLNAQVTAHQEVRALLDDTLIPQADNVALAEFLTDMRTHVSNHLVLAEALLADELD